jgi:hypothetical protein
VLDAKVLPNGNMAWLCSCGDGLREITFTGKPVVQLSHAGIDGHDFELLPNGNFLVVSYPLVSGADLSSIGGLSNTCIRDAQVRELTPRGAVVWSWFASQHISPAEINPDRRAVMQASRCNAAADAWHINSIQDAGSDFITSLRLTDAVFRINKATGNVVWKLGGTTRPGSLTIVGDKPSAGPAGGVGQHDARLWSDGSVSIFDNGNDDGITNVRPARVVRYQIDTTAHTATLVEQVHDPLITNASACCGSARWLPGGDWAIGYGQQGLNTEVTPTGSRVLSMSFGYDASVPRWYAYRMTPVLPGVLDVNYLRAAMNAMNPRSTPGAPRSVSGVPSGGGAARLIWRPPANVGGAPITGYVVRPFLGPKAQQVRMFNSAKTTAVVTALRNGKPYRFQIAARNAIGTGPWSAKTGVLKAGAPGQPGRTRAAKVRSGSLRVTFAAPASNGARITRFVATCTSSNHGATRARAGARSPVTVTRLTAGRRYVCRVRATNGRGTGPASEPSKAVTA